MLVDSEGFVVGLTTPIEFPRMKDNGIAIRTSSEVFISIVPEITMIAETAKRFEKVISVPKALHTLKKSYLFKNSLSPLGTSSVLS